jgi:hypothetical protein
VAVRGRPASRTLSVRGRGHRAAAAAADDASTKYVFADFSKLQVANLQSVTFAEGLLLGQLTHKQYMLIKTVYFTVF